MAILSHILVLLSIACLIVCAAILWNEKRTKVPYTSHYQKSSDHYETLSFIIAAICILINHLFHHYDRERSSRNMWRFLFFGVVFFIAVFSNDNVDMVNNTRILNKQSGSPSYARKMLTAYIIGYAGLWLGMITIHGPFHIRSFLALLMYAISVALAVIGVIILWNLDDVGVRSFVLSAITIPLIVTLLFLSGPILHRHIDGGLAAVLFLGLLCIWFLSRGFELKDQLIADGQSKSQQSKGWAGTLFCWFSAWVALIAARFALAAPDDENTERRYA